MAEQTFTASEVGESLALVSAAISGGADMLIKMLESVPELAKTQTTAEWIRQFAEQNVKHIGNIGEMVQKS